ncbi:hypothetical protein RvY_18912-2 [Ramazzottius varieornatus]|uniref:Uncharacterized protein n=1 Tax=Ramazzottius varieornatus TaxID=947166 RepID=A0A1D1WBW8_RAMVA|nr:hypothetical protein RvY_18912-2 [Ramazzottius varieornatus]
MATTVRTRFNGSVPWECCKQKPRQARRRMSTCNYQLSRKHWMESLDSDGEEAQEEDNDGGTERDTSTTAGRQSLQLTAKKAPDSKAVKKPLVKKQKPSRPSTAVQLSITHFLTKKPATSTVGMDDAVTLTGSLQPYRDDPRNKNRTVPEKFAYFQAGKSSYPPGIVCASEVGSGQQKKPVLDKKPSFSLVDRKMNDSKKATADWSGAKTCSAAVPSSRHRKAPKFQPKLKPSPASSR